MSLYLLGIILGSIVILLITSFVFYYLLKSRNFKKINKQIGKNGEEIISADLKLWAKTSKSVFIPGSIYKYNQDKYYEVDGILVTHKAIIIVEIKSIKGDIRGDYNSDHWEKIENDKKFLTTNPVKQNDRHIDHFIKMTNLKVPTLSLVVYSNRANSVNVTNLPGHVIVTTHNKLFNVLDEIDRTLDNRFSNNDLKVIYSTITKYKVSSQHDINHFKNNIANGVKNNA